MSDNKKIFPIKQDPACLLKWGWSSVYLNNGTTSSCHRTQKDAIDPDNFDQFHNVPGKIQDRERMLQGQWPGRGCEYCKKSEDVGSISDRQFHLQVQRDPGLTPPELYNNPLATNVTPTMLEVYFDNTCNMSCIYCSSIFSSKWAEENKKFGPILNRQRDVNFSGSSTRSNPHYDKMCRDFWLYLGKNDHYKILRRYHILGGEPFLMKQLDESIDFWDTHPNPDLVFSIITNLNIPHKRFLLYMDRFQQLVESNKIWKLQITGSLDCWGTTEQEYVRYGLDMNNWQQNFEYLLDKSWATLSINSAISALTIKKMPDLIKKINEWNVSRADLEPIILSFNWTSREDNPMIFGPGVFDNEFKEALQLLHVVSDHTQGIHDSIKSIFETINKQQKDLEKINLLKNYLEQLDHRRGTNWKLTFPWLDQIN